MKSYFLEWKPSSVLQDLVTKEHSLNDPVIVWTPRFSNLGDLLLSRPKSSPETGIKLGIARTDRQCPPIRTQLIRIASER